MKKITILLAAALIAGSFSGCKKASQSEGWMGPNKYRMVVVGAWDRERYYIEGQPAVEGKEPKSAIMLRQDAKTAAKLVAMRNFKEKMGAQIKSKTGVEDGKLIGDVIQSALEGITVSPGAFKEEYTDMNDAMITYDFEAEGLQKVVDEMASSALKKKNEGM